MNNSELNLREKLMNGNNLEDFQKAFNYNCCWNNVSKFHKQFHCKCGGEFNHKECSRCYTNNLQEISGTNIIIK